MLKRARDALLRSVGTSMFSGVTLGNWLKILRDNRCRIDVPFWPRAALIDHAQCRAKLASRGVWAVVVGVTCGANGNRAAAVHSGNLAQRHHAFAQSSRAGQSIRITQISIR